MSTIIVGVGNTVLGDDGIGIHVVRSLKDFELPKEVTLEEASTGGLNLMDMLVGFDRAILIDAVVVKELGLGEVTVLDASEMSSAHSTNPHDVSFPEALELLEKMGAEDIPEDIKIVGISIEPVTEFGEELSGPVADSIDKAREKVLELLRSGHMDSIP